MNSNSPKKIIIIEGIATSGKTTLKDKLVSFLTASNHKVVVVGEDQTLMPILHNTDKGVALKLLDEVIKSVLATDNEIVIFDRLYFTHIFRTHSTTQDFSQMFDLLLGHQVLIVLLTVEKSSIRNRILMAMEQRGSGWTEFVKKKGTDDEIAQYYIDQQDKLIDLVEESSLPTAVFNTTSGNYEEIKVEIIKKYQIYETN
jgi:thymidylate kinase